MANPLYKYPLTMGSQTDGNDGDHRITFAALKSRFSTDVPESVGMVALYLPPDALKTSYTQTYGDVDMGGLGQAILGGDRSAAESALTASMEGNMSAALEAAGKTTGGNKIMNALATSLAKEVQDAAGAKLGTAVQALEKKVGRIRNHHKAIIYQGPGGFRTFSFNFVMMPKNEDEAEEVNKIVHFFKYYMHPGVPSFATNPDTGTQVATSSGGDISSSLTLSYPEEFEIRITPRGLSGDHTTGTEGSGSSPTLIKPLFRIDHCFLESLNVDYTTSGQPVFFEDGSEPVTTSLQLSFKETKLMTKETIRRGF